MPEKTILSYCNYKLLQKSLEWAVIEGVNRPMSSRQILLQRIPFNYTTRTT